MNANIFAFDDYEFENAKGSYTCANKGPFVQFFARVTRKVPHLDKTNSLLAKKTSFLAKRSSSRFRLASKKLHLCCWAALLVFLWFGR